MTFPFQKMSKGRIKVGRKIYHLYDISGKEVIAREVRYLQRQGYKTTVTGPTNKWYALYSWPKFKR